MRSCAFWADKNQSILNNISDFAGENELMNKEKADMIIYTPEDGLTKVETTFDGATVWLSID